MFAKVKKIANNFNEDSVMYIAEKDLKMKDELIKVFDNYSDKLKLK